MFNLFSKSPSTPKKVPVPEECPIPEDSLQKIQSSWQWLEENFGTDLIKNKRPLVPHHTDFPIRYNGDPQTACDTLSIIAPQMDLDPNDIHLELYDDGIDAVSTGSPWGSKLYLSKYANVAGSAGLYFGRSEQDGKFHIWLEKKQLTQPEHMAATLAHEFSHIKLHGEGRLEENDEFLTDMTTVIYGLGAITANSFRGTVRYAKASRHSYMMEREWGFTLALYARLRGETNPAWTKHLNKNLKSDFALSQAWLSVNPI